MKLKYKLRYLLTYFCHFKKCSARPGVNNSHKDATVHPGAKISL